MSLLWQDTKVKNPVRDEIKKKTNSCAIEGLQLKSPTSFLGSSPFLPPKRRMSKGPGNEVIQSPARGHFGL